MDIFPELSRQLELGAKMIPSPGQYPSPSLSSGAALWGGLCYEIGTSLNDAALVKQAEKHLESGLSLLSENPSTSSLYRGLPGYGLVLSHLSERLDIDWASDALKDVDATLRDAFRARESSSAFEFDLINGVAGILTYSTNRFSISQSARDLHWDLLSWSCEKLKAWIASASPADGLIDTTGKEVADEDLGLAHGVPGLVGALIKSNEVSPSKDVDKVVGDALTCLWGYAISRPCGDAYFSYRQAGQSPARLAWCYGGLGIAFTFIRSGFLSAEHSSRARQLLDYCMWQYRNDKHGMQDDSVCHGRIGFSLLLSVIARSSVVDGAFVSEYLDTARDIAHSCLKLNAQNKGQLTFPYQGMSSCEDMSTFLEGWPGVILALKEIITEEPIGWMREALLIDLH